MHLWPLPSRVKVHITQMQVATTQVDHQRGNTDILQLHDALGTFRHLGIADLGQVTPNWPEIESVLPKLTGPPIRRRLLPPAWRFACQTTCQSALPMLMPRPQPACVNRHCTLLPISSLAAAFTACALIFALCAAL